jgi:hypothetical protein
MCVELKLNLVDMLLIFYPMVLIISRDQTYQEPKITCNQVYDTCRTLFELIQWYKPERVNFKMNKIKI